MAKPKIIHRSKLPQKRRSDFDPNAGILGDLKRAERELLDTAGPIGDVAKHRFLGEPLPPTKLILPYEYQQSEQASTEPPNTRLFLAGSKSIYQRGDIIEYRDGRCKYHVVVSNGPIYGVRKIPCYSYDQALIVSNKLLAVRVQPLSDAERQSLYRKLVERPT